jgi:hypothetical protein
MATVTAIAYSVFEKFGHVDLTLQPTEDRVQRKPLRMRWAPRTDQQGRSIIRMKWVEAESAEGNAKERRPILFMLSPVQFLRFACAATSFSNSP